MKTQPSYDEMFQTHAILALGSLFGGGYLYLMGASILGAVIFSLALSMMIFYVAKLAIYNKLIAIYNAGLLLLIYLPYFGYGKEIDNFRHFGSAYGIDFQQYLAVLWSLVTEGLPFKNPYSAGESATYHYGFTIPLAVILNITTEGRQPEFFDLSNIFFFYQCLMGFTFLQFMFSYFFSSRSRDWVVASLLIFFFSSYKWIYAAARMVVAGGASGFDTPFGFKTPANDFLFGSHYVFSMIFIFFIMGYFLKILDGYRFQESPKTAVAVAISAVVLPVINAFGLVILAAGLVASATLSILKSFGQHSIVRVSRMACFPVLAYLAYEVLVANTQTDTTMYLSINFVDLIVVLFSVAVNFGPILAVFAISSARRTREWKQAALTILVLLVCIACFRVSSGIEADDSFNVSRRLGTAVGWLCVPFLRVNAMTVAVRWLIAPACLTFFSQYIFFLLLDFKDPSRNERIHSGLFDQRQRYLLDEAGWEATRRVSFNFDLIVGARSCHLPNSLAAYRYTPDLRERAPAQTNQCLQGGAVEITSTNAGFLKR